MVCATLKGLTLTSVRPNTTLSTFSMSHSFASTLISEPVLSTADIEKSVLALLKEYVPENGQCPVSCICGRASFRIDD